MSRRALKVIVNNRFIVEICGNWTLQWREHENTHRNVQCLYSRRYLLIMDITRNWIHHSSLYTVICHMLSSSFVLALFGGKLFTSPFVILGFVFTAALHWCTYYSAFCRPRPQFSFMFPLFSVYFLLRYSSLSNHLTFNSDYCFFSLCLYFYMFYQPSILSLGFA